MTMRLPVHRIALGKAFADTAGMWRAERDLLIPVVGVFFFLPFFGLLLLASGFELPPGAQDDPEAMRRAFTELYERIAVPALIATPPICFGCFAVFNVLLQGGGRTLGEVLRLTIARFPMFLLLDVALQFAVNIGLWVLILPGLYLLGRTWLVEPAYAAQPEAGLMGALVRGWQASAGWNALVVLLAALCIMLAFIGAVLVVSGLVSVFAGLIGAAKFAGVILALLTSAIGSAAWVAFVVLRVALYRAAMPSNGI